MNISLKQTFYLSFLAGLACMRYLLINFENWLKVKETKQSETK